MVKALETGNQEMQITSWNVLNRNVCSISRLYCNFIDCTSCKSCFCAVHYFYIHSGLDSYRELLREDEMLPDIYQTFKQALFFRFFGSVQKFVPERQPVVERKFLDHQRIVIDV